MPIWYYYLPDEDLWVLTPPDSRKARLIINATGRFTMLVHRTSRTIRYVSVEGRVLDTGPATEDQVRLLASRYLPAELDV